jgi:hypothetical protein
MMVIGLMDYLLFYVPLRIFACMERVTGAVIRIA